MSGIIGRLPVPDLWAGAKPAFPAVHPIPGLHGIRIARHLTDGCARAGRSRRGYCGVLGRCPYRQRSGAGSEDWQRDNPRASRLNTGSPCAVGRLSGPHAAARGRPGTRHPPSWPPPVLPPTGVPPRGPTGPRGGTPVGRCWGVTKGARVRAPGCCRRGRPTRSRAAGGSRTRRTGRLPPFVAARRPARRCDRRGLSRSAGHGLCGPRGTAAGRGVVGDPPALLLVFPCWVRHDCCPSGPSRPPH